MGNLGDDKIDCFGGIGEDSEKMLGTEKKKLVFLFSATPISGQQNKATHTLSVLALAYCE